MISNIIIKNKKACALFLCVAIIFFLKVFSVNAVFTGDEPRYLHMAYSFFKLHSFNLPYSEWVTFCAENNIRLYSPTELVFVHSPIHSILISPFVGLFGPSGGRWAQFIIGLIGFVITVKLIGYNAKSSIAILCAFFIFVTMPAFPYMTLLYPEIWLLALFSVSLYLINRPSLTATVAFLGLTFALALPFFHIRMGLVSAALVVFLIIRIWRATDSQTLAKSGVVYAVLYCLLIFLGFVYFQMKWVGSLMGSANAPFRPGFIMFFECLGTQLFTSRHGLLIFNPALIFGFTGLLVGVFQKNEFARQAAILLFAYTITFVWGAASDSFPARLWVAILPVFAIGLTIWINNLNLIINKLITIIYVILAFANVALYIFNPNLFLNNWQRSQTYNALYDIFPYFHFSTLIPREKFAFLGTNLEPFFEESKYLIDVWSLATILLIVSILLSQFSKRMAVRLVSNCVIFSILIAVLQSSYMLRIEPDHAVVGAANSIELGATIITIQFKEKTRASVIRFLDCPGVWAAPKCPKEFSISTSQDGIIYKKIGNVRADSFIRLPSIENVLAIKLSAVSDPNNSQWASGEISILENKFGIRIDKCTDNCALEIEDNISFWQIEGMEEIRMGELIITGGAGKGKDYLRNGWSSPEPWGTWSNRKKAAIILPLLVEPTQDLELVINGHAFITEKHPFQIVDLLVNGQLVDTLRYDLSNNELSRVVKVPKDFIIGKGRSVLVQFKFTNPMSPAKIGVSADDRKLGLGIVSLQLKPF